MSAFWKILFVILVVGFAVRDAAGDGGCGDAAWSKTITPSSDSFTLENFLSENDNVVVETTYERSTSGDVEVVVDGVCNAGDDHSELLKSLLFGLENVETQVRFTINKATSTSTTSTSTTATSSTTSSPGQNVYPSSASSSRTTTTHTLVVVAMSLFIFSRSRTSILLMMMLVIYIVAVQSATTPLQLNIRIRLPDNFAQICENTQCIQRDGGDVRDFVTVDDTRFALISHNPEKCDDVLIIPTGWQISTSSSLASVVIAFNNWNVEHIVVADGTSYNSKKYDIVYNTGVLNNNNNNGYTITDCGAAILITQKSLIFSDGKEDLIRTVSDLKNFVTFNNYDYAVADNTSYYELALGRRQGVAYVATTSEWQIATDDEDTRLVLMSPFTIFGADCLVVGGDGESAAAAYTTNLVKCDAKLVTIPISNEQTGKSGNLIFASENGNVQARVVLRRSSSLPSNFATSSDITKQYYFGGRAYATLDNASPYSKTASSCQSHFLDIPSGWSIATTDDITKVVQQVGSNNSWPTTTCLVVNGKSLRDQNNNNDISDCASLLKVTIGGKDYYSPSVCGRILLARDITKPVDFSIGMKILVLAPSDDADATRDLAIDMLQATGMHYELFNLLRGNSSNYPGDLPLYDEITATPKYYGIVVTGDLNFKQALTSSQKNQISLYKSLYGVREVVLNTYPAWSSGATATGSGFATALQKLRVDTDFVTSNKGLFAGLRENLEFSLTNEYYVTVTLASNAVPFLRLVNGSESPSASPIVAAVITSNGEETLEFYVGNANWFEHSPILANVWLVWVTKEMWVGSRRVYLSAQVDDYFLGTEQWDDERIVNRLTGDDMRKAKQYLEALNAPEGSNITLAFGYNAKAAEEDGLYQATRELSSYFFWESHTWSHLDLTCPDSDCKTYGTTTYEDAYEELSKNIDFTREKLWAGLGELDMPTYSKDCMITPKISGLFNANALKAMVDNGITCVVGDNSVKELIPGNVYQGEWTNKDKHGYEGVFIIPRFATEIYFDVALPDTAVAEYNYRYGDFGIIEPLGNKTLEEILAYEARVTVGHLTKFRHDPYMFHQANMVHFPYSYKSSSDDVAEEKQWSLMTLWLQAIVDKYQQFMTFPIHSITHHALRDEYLARRIRDECGASAIVNIKNGQQASISVTSLATCELAFTGVKSCVGVDAGCRVEVYGADTTVWVSLSPNKSVNLSV